MKRKLTLTIGALILCVTLLNGILFYSTKLSLEYLQTQSVWGISQSVRLVDYHRQTQILSALPKDPSEAQETVDTVLQYLIKLQQTKSRYMTTKMKEELSTPPQELEGSILISDLQESDLENYRRLKNLLSGVVDYENYVDGIKSNADNIVSVLYPIANDEKVYNNALQSKRDYIGLETLVLQPVLDNGVNLILQYHVTDLLAMILLVLMTIVLYHYLKSQALTLATGLKSIGWYMLFFYLLGILSLYLSNILITWRVLGLPALSTSIQSLEAFYTCPVSMTLGSLWLLWLLFKTCSLLFLLFLGILCLSRKHPLPATLFLALLLALEWMSSRYEGKLPVLMYLREINLFSGITAERFFNRYLNVGFTVQAYPRLWMFLLTFTLPFLLLFLFSLRKLQAFGENARTALQKVYFDEIDQRYQETRRLWHDFNNHLLTIKALYGSGHASEAEDYIEQLSEQGRQILLPAKTGSNAVDLLLFQKSQICREKDIHIAFTISCNLRTLGIHDYDLCSLLGNLLDNAIEASEAVTDKTPEIALRMEERGQMLFISCKNEFRGERLEKNGQLLTTKKDSSGHGLGLLSAKQICEKYGGNLETQIQEPEFMVTLLLNGKRAKGPQKNG